MFQVFIPCNNVRRNESKYLIITKCSQEHLIFELPSNIFDKQKRNIVDTSDGTANVARVPEPPSLLLLLSPHPHSFTSLCRGIQGSTLAFP